MSDLASLTIDHFASALGQRFEAGAEGCTVALTLEAAEGLGGAQRKGGAFRLIFRGPAEPVLPQAVYPLSRGAAAYEIFIVPVARDARGTEYEAIFT